MRLSTAGDRTALGVARIDLYQLLGVDIEECNYVGSGPQDPGFARRLGFICCDASAFVRSDQDA